MKFFIVFQNRTYNKECAGGYLWAPQKDKGGKSNFHWDNMKSVKQGDIIFSVYKRYIKSVNVAKLDCYDNIRPEGLGENLWEDQGWKVDVEYNVLERPISIDEHIEGILSLCSEKYSPFTLQGNRRGNGNQGYLFEISNEFGDYLLELVKNDNSIDVENTMVQEEQYIQQVDDILSKFKDETEKILVTKARIGQGIFRNKLMTRASCCEICGINMKELLRASHCKPWTNSNNIERLDVNNGLLLCLIHDGLFDKGLIGFNDDGSIIISTKVDISQYSLMNINSNMRLSFKSEQVPFIKWHRENIFQY